MQPWLSRITTNTKTVFEFEHKTVELRNNRFFQHQTSCLFGTVTTRITGILRQRQNNFHKGYIVATMVSIVLPVVAALTYITVPGSRGMSKGCTLVNTSSAPPVHLGVILSLSSQSIASSLEIPVWMMISTRSRSRCTASPWCLRARCINWICIWCPSLHLWCWLCAVCSSECWSDSSGPMRGTKWQKMSIYMTVTSIWMKKQFQYRVEMYVIVW